MIKVDLEQGSQEWKEYRHKSRNASEASVLMGYNKAYTRTELVKNKALGIEKQVSDFVREVVFNEGHRVEPLARRFAEEKIGQFLDPIVCTDDDSCLSASLDGLSDCGKITFECKQWNATKAEEVRGGRVPKADFWQCMQGMAASGAESCLYMVSDGTIENTVSCLLDRHEDKIKRLYSAWDLFEEEVKAYVHKEKTEVVKPDTMSLPQVIIDMNTMVTANNLEEVKDQAIKVFRSIKTDLVTDQDFEDAKVSAKWCRDMVKRLDEAKQRAIESNHDVSVIMDTLAELREESRLTALKLEKLGKTENVRIRSDLKSNAEKDLSEFIAKLTNDFCKEELKADFISAMKNKRTIEGLKEGVSLELARCKADAIELDARMTKNHSRLVELAGDIVYIFQDKNKLIKMDTAVMEADVVRRVNEFREREAIRIENDRRREEAKKIEKERLEDQRIKRESERVEMSKSRVPNYNHSKKDYKELCGHGLNKLSPGEDLLENKKQECEVRQLIIDRAKDLAGDFMYYGRKEDEDLPLGEIEKAITLSKISVDEIVDAFRLELVKAINR